MAFFFGFAAFASLTTALTCATTLGWNKCFIASSFVMSRGCLTFAMVTL